VTPPEHPEPDYTPKSEGLDPYWVLMDGGAIVAGILAFHFAGVTAAIAAVVGTVTVVDKVCKRG
jgi:hypothetical protein